MHDTTITAHPKQQQQLTKANNLDASTHLAASTLLTRDLRACCLAPCCRLLTQFLPGANREIYLALHEAAVQPEAMLRDLLDAATQWQVQGCDGQDQVGLINRISPQVRAKAEALGLAAVADPGRWHSAQRGTGPQSSPAAA